MSCETRVLLVTAHVCHETDFLAAHRDALQQHGNSSLELAYFDLSRKRDFFEILILLSHVKSGFFTAVHLAPPASTWSRIRHSSSSGQPPLRTRGSPTGLSHLSPQLQLRVEESNRQVETVTWLFRASCPLHSEKSLGPTGLPGGPGRTRAERADHHLEQQPLTKTGRCK